MKKSLQKVLVGIIAVVVLFYLVILISAYI